MKEEIETLLLNDGSIEDYVNDKVRQANTNWLLIWLLTVFIFIGYAINNKSKWETTTTQHIKAGRP